MSVGTGMETRMVVAMGVGLSVPMVVTEQQRGTRPRTRTAVEGKVDGVRPPRVY